MAHRGEALVGQLHALGRQYKTERIITERVPLSDVVKGGFEELVAHNDRHVKILVDFSG
jgi:hypothetical protein